MADPLRPSLCNPIPSSRFFLKKCCSLHISLLFWKEGGPDRKVAKDFALDSLDPRRAPAVRLLSGHVSSTLGILHLQIICYYLKSNLPTSKCDAEAPVLRIYNAKVVSTSATRSHVHQPWRRSLETMALTSN